MAESKVKPEHLAEREKALELIRLRVAETKEKGFTSGVILGLSDALLDETLVLLEIKSYLTEEEWKEFISSLLKGEE